MAQFAAEFTHFGYGFLRDNPAVQDFTRDRRSLRHHAQLQHARALKSSPRPIEGDSAPQPPRSPLTL